MSHSRDLTHSRNEILANRYRLEKLLGSGFMGTVWKAHDEILDEYVALKILLPSLCVDPIMVRRFIKEVSLTRKINHPNVIRMHDAGIDNSQIFLSMELVEGETLRMWMDRARLSEEECVMVLRDICAGLSAIHDAGIVHRDIKPGNILIDGDRTAKITDLGIAYTPLSQITATQEIYGTAACMAPEQWKKDALSPATDLYALGVIAYELITGIPPANAENPMELMYFHIQCDPTPPHQIDPAISPLLSSLVLELLQKKPSQRPESADEVLMKLDEWEPQDESFEENSWNDGEIEKITPAFDAWGDGKFGDSRGSHNEETESFERKDSAAVVLTGDPDEDDDPEITPALPLWRRLSALPVFLIFALIFSFALDAVTMFLSPLPAGADASGWIFVSPFMLIILNCLFCALPVLGLRMLVQPPARAVELWSMAAGFACLFLLITLKNSGLDAYGFSDLWRFFKILNHQVQVHANDVLGLFMLSPVQYPLRLPVPVFVQNLTFLIFAVLVPAIPGWTSTDSKRRKNLLFLLVFAVLFTAESQILASSPRLLHHLTSTLSFMDAQLRTGSFQMKIPGISLFLSSLHWTIICAWCVWPAAGRERRIPAEEESLEFEG